MDIESTHRRDYAGSANARVDRLKLAIQDIINAAASHPEPIHYKVREAIERARRVASGESPP